MEKLTCPECGSPVSSTATVCENCGCKITVCPDCGIVYKVGQIRCSECGHVLSEEALYDKTKEDIKKIEERLNAEGRRNKIFSKIELALKLTGLLLIGISIAVYFLWKNQSELECLATMQSRMNLCKAICGIGLIVAIVGGEFWEIFGVPFDSIALCRWIQDTRFDYREYICVHGQNETETKEAIAYTYKLARTALFIENKKDKSLFNLYCVTKILIAIALIVSLICYMDGTVSQFFALRFVKIEFEWLTAAFYPSVIFLVCYLVVTFFSVPQKRIENKKKEILGSVKK